MATIELTADGQTFEIEDAIAGNDDLLRKALSPAYPEVANATLQRETKEGRMTVRVTKKAGTKGADPHAVIVLKRAPERVNPAVAMHTKLLALERAGHLTTTEMIRMQKEVSAAAEQGEAEVKEVRRSLKALKDSPATPGTSLPVGF